MAATATAAFNIALSSAFPLNTLARITFSLTTQAGFALEIDEDGMERDINKHGSITLRSLLLTLNNSTALGGPCIAWRSELSGLLTLTCQKANVVKAYAALRAQAKQLGITLGDVKSSISITPFPAAELQVVAQQSVMKALEATGWRRLAGGRCMRSDYLAATPGVWHDAPVISMSVGVQAPRTVWVQLHEAGVQRYCPQSPLPPRKHQHQQQEQSAAEGSALHVAVQEQLCSLLQDKNQLRAANYRLLDTICTVLPGLEVACVVSVRPQVSGSAALLAEWRLNCHGDMPQSPFYYEVTRYPGCDDTQLVPACCVWTALGLQPVPPTHGTLHSADVAAQVARDLETSPFAFWGVGGNVRVVVDDSVAGARAAAVACTSQAGAPTLAAPGEREAAGQQIDTDWATAADVLLHGFQPCPPARRTQKHASNVHSTTASQHAAGLRSADATDIASMNDASQCGGGGRQKSAAQQQAALARAAAGAERRKAEQANLRQLQPALQALKLEAAAAAAAAGQTVHAPGLPKMANAHLAQLTAITAKPAAKPLLLTKVPRPILTLTSHPLASMQDTTTDAATCNVAAGLATAGLPAAATARAPLPGSGQLQKPVLGDKRPAAAVAAVARGSGAAPRKPAAKKAAVLGPNGKPIAAPPKKPRKPATTAAGAATATSVAAAASVFAAAGAASGIGTCLGGMVGDESVALQDGLLQGAAAGAAVSAAGAACMQLTPAPPPKAPRPKPKPKPKPAPAVAAAGLTVAEGCVPGSTAAVGADVGIIPSITSSQAQQPEPGADSATAAALTGATATATAAAAARKRTKASDLDLAVVSAKVMAGGGKDCSAPELQCFLKAHKLPVGGKKADLEARVAELLAKLQAAPARMQA